MTVQATARVKRFVGNDLTTAFPFSFKTFAKADLQVVLTSATGVDATLTLDGDYSVALNADQAASPGGTITYPLTGDPLATGEKLTVTGILEAKQETNLQNAGGFFPETNETALDRLTMLIQEQAEKLARAVLASASDDDPVLSLGTSVQRADKYPAFDANGDLELAQSLPSGTLSPSSVESNLTQDGIGRVFYPETPEETASGATVVAHRFLELDIRRYGALTTDAVGDTNKLAIDRAIALAVQKNGGTVTVPPGEFKVNGQILLYNGVRLVGTGGGFAAGATQSTLRYVGTTFQDFVTGADINQDENIELHNLLIFGGEFQTGKARWIVRFQEFHRGCVIQDCRLRDGVGLIRIDSGYYSKVTRNRFQRVTPTQGVSDAEWLEVFGTNSAPIYLGVMNACDCSRNVIDTCVGEQTTGAQPTQAILVSGQDVDCSRWTIEVVGVDYDAGAFSPRCDYLIHNEGYTRFDGLYVEDADAQFYMLYATGEAITALDVFSIYRTRGVTMFYNHAAGDMALANGIIYRADWQRAWFANSAGLGVGGDVTFSNVTWRSGEPVADLFDTDGQVNPLGAADGTFVRFHNQRQVFARVVTGLAVTSGSDVSGAFVDVSGGVLLSERNQYVVTKARSSNNPLTTVSAQRLRPTTASKWYRVFVGKAGNLYLVQFDVEPTDPLGDWLAEFQTDAGTLVVGLAVNPRLAIRGQYMPGTTLAEMSFSSKPAVTDKRFANGDRAINSDPATTEAAFWVFDSSVPAWLDGAALT